MSGKRFPWSFRDVFYSNVVVVADQASAVRELKAGTIVVIKSGELVKSVKFLCPCGCGETLSVNLVRATGRAWRMSLDLHRGVSLFPSVWRDSGCESHFILRNNTARLITERVQELGEDEIERLWKHD